MYNDCGQILEFVISGIGMLIQPLDVKNPFNPASIKERLSVSYNISFYYLLLAGGLSLAANIFLSPVFILLKPIVIDKLFISIFYIAFVNVIYFLVKRMYSSIVKRKDEEDFLTRFLTKGQRRNNPYDLSNPEDKEKAEYIITYIIKPSLTAMINLVLCVILGVALTLLRVLITGKGLYD